MNTQKTRGGLAATLTFIVASTMASCSLPQSAKPWGYARWDSHEPESGKVEERTTFIPPKTYTHEYRPVNCQYFSAGHGNPPIKSCTVGKTQKYTSQYSPGDLRPR